MTIAIPTDVGSVTTASSGSTAGPLVVAKPTNTADGDLLICFFSTRNAGSTVTAPTGWTASTSNTTNETFSTFYKAIPSAASEAATTYSFSFTGGAGRTGLICFRVTGANLTTPIDATGALAAYTGTTSIALPAVTAVSSAAMLIGFAIANLTTTGGTVFTAPSGFTTIGQVITDNGTTTSGASWVGSKLLSSSGTTGIQTPTLSPTAANSGGFMVTINPVAVANVVPTITCSTPLQNIPTSTTTATVTFAGNDTDGTISSMSATVQSFTGATAPTIGAPSYTGKNTANCTASFLISGLVPGTVYIAGNDVDNVGGANVTAAIAQINSTSTTPAYRSATSASYSVVGGAANALAALNRNAPTTDYLQSPTPPAGVSDTITFNPLDAAAVPVTFGVTGRASDAVTTLTRTVSLMQGATVIATRSATLTTTDSTVGGTTTTSETNSITDRSALSVKYSDA